MYSIISMIPKEPNSTNISQFGPKKLLKADYKLLTKTLTLRLQPHIENIVSNEK